MTSEDRQENPVGLHVTIGGLGVRGVSCGPSDLETCIRNSKIRTELLLCKGSDVVPALSLPAGCFVLTAAGWLPPAVLPLCPPGLSSLTPSAAWRLWAWGLLRSGRGRLQDCLFLWFCVERLSQVPCPARPRMAPRAPQGAGEHSLCTKYSLRLQAKWRVSAAPPVRLNKGCNIDETRRKGPSDWNSNYHTS